MIIFKRNTSLTVFIFINLFVSSIIAIELTIKIVNFEYGNKLLVDRHHYASPGMVFGQCDDTQQYVKNRQCTFVLETDKSIDSADHLHTCEIELQAGQGRKLIGKVHKVTGFGGNKAVLTYEEQYGCYKFAIIDFSGCQVFYSHTHGLCAYKPDILAVKDDTLIDIIEQGSSKSSCNNSKYCRMILDAEGNLVTWLSEWKSVKDDVISMIFSPSKGRLIVAKSHNRTQVRAIGGDNEGRFPISLIKEYHYQPKLSYKIATSNTQEYFTVCHETSSWSQDSDISTCDCSQFNIDGKLMFDIRQKFTVAISSISVHNLPDGGFLLLVKPCLLSDSHTCENLHDNTFIATKIDDTGESAGSIGISQFRFDKGFRLNNVNFFVNEKNQYCLSTVYKQENNDHRAKMAIVCFSENEMEVSDHWTPIIQQI